MDDVSYQIRNMLLDVSSVVSAYNDNRLVHTDSNLRIMARVFYKVLLNRMLLLCRDYGMNDDEVKVMRNKLKVQLRELVKVYTGVSI